MMTQQLGFSILSAPLAAIDRRVLSQAWYSALHLARDASVAPAARLKPAPPQNQSSMPVARRADSPAPPKAAASKPRAFASPSLGRAETPDERRAAPSALAVRIERALRQPAARANGITLGVAGSRGRIHIALQIRGNRVRLVALCRPAARQAVAHALTQARYALAARGIELEVPAQGIVPCS